MAQLFEGTFQKGRIVNAEIGYSGNSPRVKWDVVVEDDGPHKGKVAKYSGKLEEKYIAYTKRDMIAIGWQGQSIRTFVDDVKRANKAVPFTAEIASFKRDDGSVSEWTSAKFGASKPLDAPTADQERDLDRWFSQAGTAGSGREDLPF